MNLNLSKHQRVVPAQSHQCTSFLKKTNNYEIQQNVIGCCMINVDKTFVELCKGNDEHFVKNKTWNSFNRLEDSGEILF